MKAWKLFFSERRNTYEFIIISLSLAFTLFSFLYFLEFNENRTGYIFHDPILSFFDPTELSVLIFFLTYSFAIWGLIISFRKPELFLLLFVSYTILTCFRMLCLYLLPLEPPAGLIPLNDIFLHSTFYSGRDNLKDLFFSGHTASIFLFALLFRDKHLKLVFIAAAFIIGILLVIQHVHFSIDIVMALIAAWLVVKATKKIPLKCVRES
jgi:membrane-associated phospholipid phosphatase